MAAGARKQPKLASRSLTVRRADCMDSDNVISPDGEDKVRYPTCCD